MRACSVLVAHCDDKAGQFEQSESADIRTGNSHGQVIAVRHGLRPLLRGALVLVATGHSGGDDDGDGDNGGGGSSSDARICIAEAG